MPYIYAQGLGKIKFPDYGKFHVDNKAQKFIPDIDASHNDLIKIVDLNSFKECFDSEFSQKIILMMINKLKKLF